MWRRLYVPYPLSAMKRLVTMHVLCFGVWMAVTFPGRTEPGWTDESERFDIHVGDFHVL